MRRRPDRRADHTVAVERDDEVRVLAVQPRLAAETTREPEYQVVLGLALEQEPACALEEGRRVRLPLDMRMHNR